MPLQTFLTIGALLFVIGLAIVVTKKNTVVVLMGIELMFNASTINLVAFSNYAPQPQSGHLLALFIMVIAAAEIAVALAIVVKVFKHFQTTELDKLA